MNSYREYEFRRFEYWKLESRIISTHRAPSTSVLFVFLYSSGTAGGGLSLRPKLTFVNLYANSEFSFLSTPLDLYLSFCLCFRVTLSVVFVFFSSTAVVQLVVAHRCGLSLRSWIYILILFTAHLSEALCALLFFFLMYAGVNTNLTFVGLNSNVEFSFLSTSLDLYPLTSVLLPYSGAGGAPNHMFVDFYSNSEFSFLSTPH